MIELLLIVLLLLVIISLLPLDVQAKNIAYIVLVIVIVLKLFHLF
jgi:hypothetical protein